MTKKVMITGKGGHRKRITRCVLLSQTPVAGKTDTVVVIGVKVITIIAAINVRMRGIIAIEVIEHIIVLVPVLPNNDAIIALVLTIVVFDMNIDVFIVRVLNIVTFNVRVLVMDSSIEAITMDQIYDLQVPGAVQVQVAGADVGCLGGSWRSWPSRCRSLRR